MATSISLAPLINDVLNTRADLSSALHAAYVVVATVEQRLGYTLGSADRAHVEIEAACAYNTRKELMAAALRDTQERLHQPGRMF